MYRCHTCGGVSSPRQTMKRYIVYREKCYHCGSHGTEVEREIPICDTCAAAIARGVPLSGLPRLREALQGPSRTVYSRVKVQAPSTAPLVVRPPVPVQAIQIEDEDGDGEEGTPSPNSYAKEAGDSFARSVYVPRCDICGHPAGDGQVTDHTVLCKFHCNMT